MIPVHIAGVGMTQFGKSSNTLVEIMRGLRVPGRCLLLGLGAVGDRQDDLIELLGEIAARDAKIAHPEMSIAAIDWWVILNQMLPKDTFEVWGGWGHAGEVETSLTRVAGDEPDLRAVPSHIQHLD